MQDLITYSIVIFSIIYTIYQFIKFFIPNKNSAISCGSSCPSCEIKNDILKQYELKNLTLPGKVKQ